MGRLHWDHLPPEVHRAIEERLGARITRVDDQVPHGTADFSGAVHTKDGAWFVKAVRQAEHIHARSRNEEQYLNRLLPHTAPRLLWRSWNAEWVLTGYEYIDGRHASLTPGSAELPTLIRLLSELAVPVVQGAEHFPSLGARWSTAAPWRTLANNRRRSLGAWERQHLNEFIEKEQYVFDVLFGGTSIAHTDVSESSVLIGRSGIRITGWTWATRAPAWVDAAVFAVRLVESGHTPAEADAWVAHVPAWNSAALEALDGFSVALLGLWTVTSRSPELIEAARRYTAYRLAISSSHQ